MRGRGLKLNKGDVGTLNRPVVISDCASLINGSSNYYVLGLTKGAAVATESEEETIVSELALGGENIVVRVQGEFAYNLGIKGYTWDTGNGGVNPDNTALALNTNWDWQMASVKDGPGICVTTTVT